MNTINNSVFSQFESYTIPIKNQSELKHKKNPNRSIEASTTAIGTIAGYGLYKHDVNKAKKWKIEYKSKMENIKPMLDSAKSKLEDTQVKKIINKLIEDIGSFKVGQPNCLKIMGDDDKLYEILINELKRNSNCKYLNAKEVKKLLSNPEEAKEYFQNAKLQTLMPLKEVKKIIELIRGLKLDAKNYYPTVILNIKNSSILKPELPKNFKVKTIEIGNIAPNEIKNFNTINKEVNTFTKKHEIYMGILNSYVEKIPKTKIIAGSVLGLLCGLIGIRIKQKMESK